MKELIVNNLYGIRGEIRHRTDANVLVVAGESGAGKSSFVNSFVHVFAHKSVKGSDDPVHNGQIEGAATYIDEELGLSFGRRWKNGKMSSVEIRALDGAKHEEKPAEMLKERIGSVTVDVSEFLSVDESKRRELIMAKAVFPEGFDLAALAADQTRVELERTNANREKTRLEGALSQLVPPSASTPDAEVSAADLIAEHAAAIAHNASIDAVLRSLESAQADRERAETNAAKLAAELDAARLLVTESRAAEVARHAEFKATDRKDTSDITARLESIDGINAAVRAKATFAKARADLDAAAASHKALDVQLQGIKQAKFEGLAQAVLPHPALSVDDEFVRWNGTAFSNTNSAARALAAVSVAIAGEHDENELRLVILKDGDWLDPKSLAAVDELLTAKGFFGLVDRGRPDMPDAAGIDVIELADGQVVA